MRILIVEDLPDQAESLRTILEAEGHTCFIALTLSSAIGLAELHPPDVIILDWVLAHPSVSITGGPTFLAWVKTHPKLKDVKVIISTGLPEEKTTTAEGIKILRKPYTVKTLLKELGDENDRIK